MENAEKWCNKRLSSSSLNLNCIQDWCGSLNTKRIGLYQKDNEFILFADSSTSNATTGSGSGPVDPYPKKLRDTVNARLKSDAITCTTIFVLTTLLHWSGFFAKLQPNLNYVLWIMTGLLGFSQHYVLPQLRKQLPWLCFSHPILKSREYGQFEV